jgi:hypothetical protein
MAPPRKRSWTLEAARRMLVEVRTRTAAAVPVVERLLRARDGLASDAPERPEIEEQLRARIGRWAREMEALGVDVKGLWLVDFDNGSGCYCWRWPEEELAFYHGHDDGFAGRVRIQ